MRVTAEDVQINITNDLVDSGVLSGLVPQRYEHPFLLNEGAIVLGHLHVAGTWHEMVTHRRLTVLGIKSPDRGQGENARPRLLLPSL